MICYSPDDVFDISRTRLQVPRHANGEAEAEQHLVLEEGDGRPGGQGGHLHHQIQVIESESFVCAI